MNRVQRGDEGASKVFCFLCGGDQEPAPPDNRRCIEVRVRICAYTVQVRRGPLPPLACGIAGSEPVDAGFETACKFRIDFLSLAAELV
jgi:hypothetical protein